MHKIDQNLPPEQPTYAEALAIFRALDLDMSTWHDRVLLSRIAHVGELSIGGLTDDAILDKAWYQQTGQGAKRFQAASPEAINAVKTMALGD